MKLLSGLAIAMCLTMGFSGTAAAKFSAVGKEGKGSGENIELEIVAGGATIVCNAYEGGESKATWTIEESGKAASEGADLTMNFENWGKKCKGKSSEIAEKEATVSGCQFQVSEPNEEEEVAEKVLTTCTIKLASCEIKILSEKNKALNVSDLFNSGIENKNLVLVLEAKNLTTTISGSCPGIKSTEAGTIVNRAEMQQVRPAIQSEFRAAASPEAMPNAFRTPPVFAINEATRVTVENTGAAQTPFEWGFSARPPASLVKNGAAELACSTANYAAGGRCSFKIEFVNAGRACWSVAGANMERAMICPRT